MRQRSKSGGSRKSYSYFEVLEYDLALSIRRAMQALQLRPRSRARQSRQEARHGYEAMIETLKVAKLTPHETAFLHEKIDELRRLLLMLGEKG